MEITERKTADNELMYTHVYKLNRSKISSSANMASGQRRFLASQ